MANEKRTYLAAVHDSMQEQHHNNGNCNCNGNSNPSTLTTAIFTTTTTTTTTTAMGMTALATTRDNQLCRFAHDNRPRATPHCTVFRDLAGHSVTRRVAGQSFLSLPSSGVPRPGGLKGQSC